MESSWRGVLRPLVVGSVAAALHLGSATPAHAGGMPLRVWLSMKWVESVLEGEAPGLEAPQRAELARVVAEETLTHELDPALVLAVIRVESNFRAQAVSPRGARGFMQVMPYVAKEMTGGAVTAAALEDPATNVRLGVTLLHSLVTEYDGQLPRALAAYNMGSRRLRGLLHPVGPLKDKDLLYARRVMALADSYRAHYPRAAGAEG